MPASVPLRRDFDARHLLNSPRCKDARQSRRLLSLAAVYDGMSRGEAARIGGMDRQTLRDWVHRFNEEGPWPHQPQGRGPDALPERCPDERTWRDCRDRPRSGGGRGCPLAADRPEIEARFGVIYSERGISRLLGELGFAHISARPQHPRQDKRSSRRLKKAQFTNCMHGV